MKILKYIILSAVALLLGCSSEKLIEPAFDLGLIVYLGGDNDLSQETTEKLDAICAAWPEAENGRLLV
ncbi:MAG: clostripain, partial [Massilibacteroides sp.]|nr:clostripain [Massilibacteroides sp.]